MFASASRIERNSGNQSEYIPKISGLCIGGCSSCSRCVSCPCLHGWHRISPNLGAHRVCTRCALSTYRCAPVRTFVRTEAFHLTRALRAGRQACVDLAYEYRSSHWLYSYESLPRAFLYCHPMKSELFERSLAPLEDGADHGGTKEDGDFTHGSESRMRGG